MVAGKEIPCIHRGERQDDIIYNSDILLSDERLQDGSHATYSLKKPFQR